MVNFPIKSLQDDLIVNLTTHYQSEVDKDNSVKFGFTVSKLSALCGEESFLNPGIAFPVFLINQKNIENSYDCTKPIGQVFIRTEFTPNAVPSESDNSHTLLLTSKLKKLNSESATQDHRIKDLQKQIQEYEKYI